jgi:hypothetical protein
MSQTGRYVLFESESRMLAPRDGPGVDLFLRDRRLGTTRTVTELVGPGSNSGGYYPSITANGRYVAFTSYSANLVPSDTNNTFDLFIRDVRRQTTTRLVPPGRRQIGGQRRLRVAVRRRPLPCVRLQLPGVGAWRQQRQMGRVPARPPHRQHAPDQ